MAFSKKYGLARSAVIRPNDPILSAGLAAVDDAGSSTCSNGENDGWAQLPGLTGYPGSKAASGLVERILREMPPHDTYVEAFAGYAAVARKKRPAAKTILIDVDPVTVQDLIQAASSWNFHPRIVEGDALQILTSHPAMGSRRTLVYVDPPYLKALVTRNLYRERFDSEEQHECLLKVIKKLKCMVIISGYFCPLYDRLLKKWRRVAINAMTRGGPRIECLWCNFPEATVLHDPRFAGGDYRERERIKRKARRWAAKFSQMPPRERQALAVELVRVDRAAVESAMSTGSHALTL